ALGGLARLFQHRTVAREEPAVVDAPQSTIFTAAVTEIDAAVRAGSAEQSGLAVVIAKEHQIFAHEFGRDWRERPQLARERNGLPVAAQESAARRTGTREREPFVLFRREHYDLQSALVASFAPSRIDS